MRVIGIGNLDRGDDAAGRLVARRLRELKAPGFEVLELGGDAASLLDAWRGAPAVIVVDAVRSGRAPGALVRLEAGRDGVPPAGFSGSTHGLGLAEAVGLARALGELPASLVIYGIEGANFQSGAPVTPAVRESALSLAGAIASGTIP